jgi:hypothetical protein
MNQQENASTPQLTQPLDTAPASQPDVTTTSVPAAASPSHVSAPWPTPQQQYLAMMLQPKSPTEVLANRIPHANGVTWVFQDLATGMLRHVDVPNVPGFTHRQPGQGTTRAVQARGWYCINHHLTSFLSKPHKLHRLLGR